MNNPEYIPVEEMGTVVAAVKTALALPVLNYQFGTGQELNETLQQYSADPALIAEKYPLVFFEEPFEIDRGFSGVYGKIDIVKLFIIMQSQVNYKAAQRKELVYKAVIWPIYRELLRQIDLSIAFSTQAAEVIDHTIVNRYLIPGLNDNADCSIVTIKSLVIANNLNCNPVHVWS